MALCIFDVDHFKKFNDTYGHVAGNIALMDVASRIAKQARTMDIVCRYGGEEFVVILPKCNLEGAVLFAERVRESVMASPVKTDAQSVPVTISVGVAEYLPNEEQSAFIERANNALYRAKEGGRNCVRAADETPPE
jgi:diguanylate cyclase (GGDEF)-like protein